MSNPIFVMLLGVGIGLAVSLYVYLQDQRVQEHAYGNNRPSNRGSHSRDGPECSETPSSGSQGSRRARRRENSRDPQSKDQCTICLEDDMSQNNSRTLTCNHRFHSKCISVWFREKHSCPTCRTEFGSSH